MVIPPDSYGIYHQHPSYSCHRILRLAGFFVKIFPMLFGPVKMGVKLIKVPATRVGEV